MLAAQRPAARATRSSSRPRPRLIALLIVGPLLCVVALTSLAYLGLSQQAQRDALAQVGVAAQAAHDALQVNTGALTLTNGQLASALPANVTTLNNNNAETQRLRTQTGLDTLIAQREHTGYIIIASSLASAGGASAGGLGDSLNGAIATNACASNTRATTGALTIGGDDYLAGSVPLVDGSGACVGVVVAIMPQSALQQTPLEYTVILAMAGALLTLITVAVGLMLHGRSARASDTLDDERVRAAVATLAQAQAAYAEQMEQREWVGKRLATGRRHMQRLMTSLAADRVALQDATADIWAGVSHPGAPIDPAVAMRLAREGAVVAARIGARLNDFDAVSSALFADLTTADEVDATLDTTLAQTDATIAELRALTGEEAAAPHDPFATNRLEAQRLRTGQTPSVAPTRAQARPQTGGYRAVRPDPRPEPRGQRPEQRPEQPRPETGQHRSPRPESGQHRAVGGHDAPRQPRQTPAPGQSQQGQQGRRPSSLGASGSAHRQPWQNGSSGRHSAQHPAAHQPPTPRTPPNNEFNGFGGFDTPSDGRDRGASGSRWLND